MMKKNAFIFGLLADKLLVDEPVVSKSKAKTIVSNVAKELGVYPPRIIWGGEDYHDPDYNILSLSGSRPAFYHELGHFIQHHTGAGRILERMGDLGQTVADYSVIVAPLLYAQFRRYMKPSKAFIFSILAPIIGTLGSVTAELGASIRGQQIAPEEKIVFKNIPATLTYVDPVVSAATAVGAVRVLEKALQRIARRA